MTTSTSTAVTDDVVAAANTLFRNRHHLTPDVLRTIAGVWFCACAARYGEPHERFWEDQDDEAYAAHDVVECEDENSVDDPFDVHDCGNPGCPANGSTLPFPPAHYTPEQVDAYVQEFHAQPCPAISQARFWETDQRDPAA